MKKTKALTPAQFLSMLQKVLSATAKDPHLASTIYDSMAKEVNLYQSLQSFEKFCEEGSLPNLEAATVDELKTELSEKFGEENVTITPDEAGTGVSVEIATPEKTVSSQIKVASGTMEEEEAAKVPFVPFPVSLPQDPSLVWVLGRREDLGPDEAARSLSKIEEEFWQTKKGQQLQKDRVEKSFAEFIVQVPAASLTESGLKRHYKTPEPLKMLRLLGGGGAASVELEIRMPEAEKPAPRPMPVPVRQESTTADRAPWEDEETDEAEE